MLVVFALPSALATLSIIILMAITAASALRYLFGRKGMGLAWLCALVSLFAFVAIAILTTMHFDVMTGADIGGSSLLPILIPASAAIGILLVLRLRLVAPEAYDAIGSREEL